MCSSDLKGARVPRHGHGCRSLRVEPHWMVRWMVLLKLACRPLPYPLHQRWYALWVHVGRDIGKTNALIKRPECDAAALPQIRLGGLALGFLVAWSISGANRWQNICLLGSPMSGAMYHSGVKLFAVWDGISHNSPWRGGRPSSSIGSYRFGLNKTVTTD